jgi:hypothetical protein
MLSTGAYGWWNDGDSNNTSATTSTAPDMQQAYGIEFSSGVRGHGISADAEYQFINGELYDGMYTNGLYQDGATDLNKFSLNGGYMLPGTRVELVSGWMIMDASNFEVPEKVTTVGANWYIKGKADIRYALTYNRTLRMTKRRSSANQSPGPCRPLWSIRCSGSTPAGVHGIGLRQKVQRHQQGSVDFLAEEIRQGAELAKDLPFAQSKDVDAIHDRILSQSRLLALSTRNLDQHLRRL